MPVRPVDFLRWTTNSPTNRIDVPVTQRENGWAINQRPPFEFMNQLFFEVDEWLRYLDSVAETVAAMPQVIVHSDPQRGQFTSLQAAHDDPSVVAGTTILVASDLEIMANQQISKQDIGITFVPGARLIKAAEAPDGIRALEVISTADRVRIQHVRFEGFSGAGDVALWLDVNADNVLLFNLIFGAGMTTNIETNSNKTFVQALTMEL